MESRRKRGTAWEGWVVRVWFDGLGMYACQHDRKTGGSGTPPLRKAGPGRQDVGCGTAFASMGGLTAWRVGLDWRAVGTPHFR